MKNFENLTESELMNINAGYSWYDFGRDVGDVLDAVHGIIDSMSGNNCR